jgi:hypothetical protein
LRAKANGNIVTQEKFIFEIFANQKTMSPHTLISVIPVCKFDDVI